MPLLMMARDGVVVEAAVVVESGAPGVQVPAPEAPNDVNAVGGTIAPVGDDMASKGEQGISRLKREGVSY